MSKNLFLQLREQEIANLYPATFTKKEAVETGKAFVQSILDNGEVSKEQTFTNIVRLKAVLDTIESELRANIPFEKLELNGVSFTPVNGGVIPNYIEDPIYAQLKEDLKAREDLLKLALKQDIIDAYGNDVPKVSVTHRKDSLTVKF